MHNSNRKIEFDSILIYLRAKLRAQRPITKLAQVRRTKQQQNNYKQNTTQGSLCSNNNNSNNKDNNNSNNKDNNFIKYK
jgi:hypothetical protein